MAGMIIDIFLYRKSLWKIFQDESLSSTPERKAVNSLIKKLFIFPLIIGFCTATAQALDFDKEIFKQEIVSLSLREDLKKQGKLEKGVEKIKKKQDLQVVLIPKVTRN